MTQAPHLTLAKVTRPRLEKEALKRIEDCRAVMGRRGDPARRSLLALLDGKLTFKPLPLTSATR